MTAANQSATANAPAPPSNDEGEAGALGASSKLELSEVELVGGGRRVRLHPGLNLVHGDMGSGKTTFVRLIRALLGSVPDDLPPETKAVEGIKAKLVVGDRLWQVFRPLVTTSGAPVEVAEAPTESDHEPVAFRLPATGASGSFSEFLLTRLGIPAVRVPQARTKPTGKQTTVSMTDWLNYCIIPGDELDTQVFGHLHPFRNGKRIHVFELAYGLYDFEAAQLTAHLRSIELRLEALEQQDEIQSQFLAQTPFADAGALLQRIAELEVTKQNLQVRQKAIAERAASASGTADLRSALSNHELKRQGLRDQHRMISAQLEDLLDLKAQLQSQSARLTRAIVADEWLVDFDFVVCPRCGTDVESTRALPQQHCYLCLQPPRPAPSRDYLLSEQTRIVSQISETDEVIRSRERSLESVLRQSEESDAQVVLLRKQIEERTATYVSERLEALQRVSRAEFELDAEQVRLREYLVLYQRYETTRQTRDALEAKKAEILLAIERHELSDTGARDNIAALEIRLLEYLQRLNIPSLDDLTVRINRKTYMPEVGHRKFDELSSQGLKTLVNIAHALAHHTVAIDRTLPMPGLLVLDGISANAGHEGFDQARINDVYRLLMDVAHEYSGRLQIIAVDNDLPRDMFIELTKFSILPLTQNDRLIRVAKEEQHA